MKTSRFWLAAFMLLALCSMANSHVPLTKPDYLTASFPGGNEFLRSHIRKHLVYPREARENGIEGTVKVRFLVGPKGSIKDITIVESVGYGCDRAALTLVRNMPKWNPARFNDQFVPSRVNLSFHFHLD